MNKFSQVAHNNCADLYQTLGSRDVIFSYDPSSNPIPQDILDRVSAHVELHFTNGAAGLIVDQLYARDLIYLRRFTPHVFVKTSADLPDFPRGDVAQQFVAAGFKVFFAHGSGVHRSSPITRYSLIGTAEFLGSSLERLTDFPSIAAGNISFLRRLTESVRTVFVLNLIQDFEILLPLLERARVSDGMLDVHVAVSELVGKSAIWSTLGPYLAATNTPWIRAADPMHIVGALGQKRSLLITASESTAPGHSLCYRACQAAPARAIKVTVQHGYENIGLRHHSAHDALFPGGIRFASDIIMTWDAPDKLPDLAAVDRDRVLPVGISKLFAENAAATLEKWHSGDSFSKAKSDTSERQKLLIGDNLQSTRFSIPSRRQRFLEFVRATVALEDCDTVIRSHPAKPQLEDPGIAGKAEYDSRSMSASALNLFDAVVSAPSTLIMDSAISWAPVAIWTDAPRCGDLANYSGLEWVTDPQHVEEFLTLPRSDVSSKAFKWAIDNTCSLNGVAPAWSALLNLVY